MGGGHEEHHDHGTPGGHHHGAHHHIAAYRDAEEHFADHSIRLLLHLKHYILRYWHRLTDAGGTLSDAYVSVHEALQSLGAHVDVGAHLPDELRTHASAEGLAAIEAELRECERHIQQRLAKSVDGVPLPIEDMRAIFRLGDAEVDVLLTLARLQSDLEFSRLCTFAWADFTRKQADLAFLVDLLSVPATRRAEVTAALSPEGRLFAQRLVTLHDTGDFVPQTPHFYQRAAVPDRVVLFLRRGATGIATLPRSIRWADGVARERIFVEEEVQERADTAWCAVFRNPSQRQALLLWGPEGVGKKTLAATLARGEGRRLLVITLGATPAPTDVELESMVAEGLREALLQGAVPLIDLGSGLPGSDEHETRHAAESLQRGLLVHEGPLLFSATQPQPWLTSLCPVHEVAIPFTPPHEQLRAWRHALDGVPLRESLDPEYMANRFNLTASRVRRTVESAVALGSTSRFRRGGARGREIGEAELVTSARHQVTHNLGALATPVFSTLGWSDLVLPPTVAEQLREIERMMSHRSKVYDDWGFRRVAGGRQGLRVLFSGPPGTGKTLAASVIGRSLAREVYRIDLSRVLDKFIGETEKNLARLFDESEYAQVLLLFDEADSLFAGRTTVKSVHDRYANVQVNFLLQRIETFEGICILTTNYEENIDPAFKRRLQAWVRFPKPDQTARERLWRSMIPAAAEVEGTIDFGALAQGFELTGGHIRNTVLRAAFRAASEGTAITQRHLEEAGIVEAEQLGQLVRMPGVPGPVTAVE